MRTPWPSKVTRSPQHGGAGGKQQSSHPIKCPLFTQWMSRSAWKTKCSWQNMMKYWYFKLYTNYMFSSLKFKLLSMSSLLYFIAYKREYKNISHYKSSQNKTAIQVGVMASLQIAPLMTIGSSVMHVICLIPACNLNVGSLSLEHKGNF